MQGVVTISKSNELKNRLVDYLKKLSTGMSQVTGSRPVLKITLLVCIPVIAVLVFFSSARCAVVMGDEVIAVASTREAAETAVEEYFNHLEQVTGMPVKIDKDIKYRPSWRFSSVVDKGEMQKLLSSKINVQYGATGIFADGKMVVAVKDQQTGQKVFDRLLDTYKGNSDTTVAFKQKVELKHVETNPTELADVDKAVEYIRFGGSEARKYKIKEGDTLWDIASAAHMDVEELTRSNPDLKPETMQIDQEIVISQTSPLIDVIATCTETRQEEMAFRVQEKVDNSLYLGEKKLVQQGKPGQREVVYNVTSKNGVEISKKVVQAKVLQEPVPQIVAKGEKKLLAFRGGNSRLAYPTVGAIVSPFGKRWGRMHEGVDIAASYGSPVVAAEAGTVMRVGTLGGYGLRIDISHGGGVVTRYAHLSSTAVKAGQRVERGQFVGRSGSSGNSTGPHLHFEVIVNGVHKNPSLFI
ncbi:Murein DD-endopeptidase MepM and murein hydrolase activator NlpD, contain LysM domain [Desulfotomaculum arcticum]|uniref:Murein DD-endopeptidase MepM and murein hydrolase activator NlpD, contain LysM domain n=1 Tax=Desulfotruncus arcticus DSM 17038 TaxID=1121424 RepID=A0A1I2VMH3_9FIRM|nr:M23 family metallopeptidase [Desulfotruncus arcticus]SFG88391.1 Murein DD-endopeptidase MepM and murein hydrolase activator NlpD, contain LysM domain [Desulfotomaculum arcticum] [Desulfotruncus arcticus DSM 17038]